MSVLFLSENRIEVPAEGFLKNESVPKLFQHGGIIFHGGLESGHQFSVILPAAFIRCRREDQTVPVRAKGFQNAPGKKTVNGAVAGEQVCKQPESLDAIPNIRCRGRGIEGNQMANVIPLQLNHAAAAMDVGLLYSVQCQQIPVEFRLQGVVAQGTLIGQSVDQGVAAGIQAIVSQKTVKIHQTFFGAISGKLGAAIREKFTACPVMKNVPQLGDIRGLKGLIEKEEIRTLKACVKKPAVPADGGPNICGELGQNLDSESVMGINGRHFVTSGVVVQVIVHDAGEKSHSVSRKFT